MYSLKIYYFQFCFFVFWSNFIFSPRLQWFDRQSLWVPNIYSVGFMFLWRLYTPGGVQPTACGHVRPKMTIIQPNTKSLIYLKRYEIFLFLLVFVYLMCGPRQPFLLPVWSRDAKSLDAPGKQSWGRVRGDAAPMQKTCLICRLGHSALDSPSSSCPAC